MMIVSILVFLLTLKGLILCFLWLMVTFGLGEIYFIICRNFYWVFFMNGYYILSISFWIFVEIIFFLSILIWLIIHPCIPGIKLIMVASFLMCHYILFVTIFFIFVCVFIKVIGLWLSIFLIPKIINVFKLQYSWHRKVNEFQLYNIVIVHRYTLGSDHSDQSISHLSQYSYYDTIDYMLYAAQYMPVTFILQLEICTCYSPSAFFFVAPCYGFLFKCHLYYYIFGIFFLFTLQK